MQGNDITNKEWCAFFAVQFPIDKLWNQTRWPTRGMKKSVLFFLSFFLNPFFYLTQAVLEQAHLKSINCLCFPTAGIKGMRHHICFTTDVLQPWKRVVLRCWGKRDALEITIEQSQNSKYCVCFLSFVVPKLFNRDAENYIYIYMAWKQKQSCPGKQRGNGVMRREQRKVDMFSVYST